MYLDVFDVYDTNIKSSSQQINLLNSGSKDQEHKCQCNQCKQQGGQKPWTQSRLQTSHCQATELATCNNRGMEGSRKPENTSSDQDKSAMPGTPPSDRSEMLHSQTDSFIMAARLVRRGWPSEGNKTNRQFSQSDGSARQPTLTSSEGDKAPVWVRICHKDPRRGWTLDMNSGKTAPDEKTGFEKDDKAKETSEGAASPNRQTGVVYVWKSGCRVTYRQTRRFKAPVLPAIAEM